MTFFFDRLAINLPRHSPIAQLVEQVAVNHRVRGSSPRWGATLSAANFGDPIVLAVPRCVSRISSRSTPAVFKISIESYMLIGRFTSNECHHEDDALLRGASAAQRPYIEPNWCAEVIAAPLRSERQPDGRIRFWGAICSPGVGNPIYSGSSLWKMV